MWARLVFRPVTQLLDAATGLSLAFAAIRDGKRFPDVQQAALQLSGLRQLADRGS